MKRVIFTLFAALTVVLVHAELQPPERTLRPVADESNVVIDRGAKLEVFANQRALPKADTSGRVVAHQLVPARPADPIGPRRLGVLFNHAEQQQGYITGEITFKVKDGHTFSGSPALYPGLKEITKPAVYVVNARTPGEFITLLKRLQARSDLAWVEPTITYGRADTTLIIR
jgi:hypothetical protein